MTKVYVNVNSIKDCRHFLGDSHADPPLNATPTLCHSQFLNSSQMER